MPAAERPALLVEHVGQQVQRVLQLASVPEEGVGFFELGMDSLMAVELRNRLQGQLGSAYPLSSTLALDYPNVRALAGHLAGRLLALPEPTRQQEPPTPQVLEAEGIAVIGLACRFPGAADAEAFWQLLREGRDAITEVPAERWDVEAYYDPDPETPGRMYTRHGGFLEQVDRFDPQFFGISPREAASMDPQQRLLLEVSWHALEHAGQAPARLAGSHTGVFVGLCSNDYVQMRAIRWSGCRSMLIWLSARRIARLPGG